jgi:hypothetical protein
VDEAVSDVEGVLEHSLMLSNRYECGGLKLLCEAKLYQARARLMLELTFTLVRQLSARPGPQEGRATSGASKRARNA